MSSQGDSFQTLGGAQEANPFWFGEVVEAARKMISRRAKYSGKTDPYTNFIIMARALGLRVSRVFVFYKIIKLARDLVGAGDFEDESAIDTDHDEGNYAFLSAGWRRRSPQSRLKAMMDVGNWVEVETLSELGLNLKEWLDHPLGGQARAKKT
jgi:hypothetical protein